jgi:hypothetical protein
MFHLRSASAQWTLVILALLSLTFTSTAHTSQIPIGERSYAYDANGNQTG